MSDQSNYGEFVRELQIMGRVVSPLPETVGKPAVNTAFRRFGRGYVAYLQKSMRGPSSDKGVLHRRTGVLSRAFSHVVNDGVLTIMIDSTASKYWKTHEYGAQGVNAIKAKPGKALAIPVGPSLTPAGVAKYKSPRDVPDLFMLKYKRANTGKQIVLAKVQGRKLVVYFILVKKVEVKPRLGMRKMWYEKLPGVIPILQEEIMDKIREVKR